MKCPFCSSEMKRGTLSGDGRSKVRWHSNDENVNAIDKIMGKGMIDAKYSLTKFEIETEYCPTCHKMIFDTFVLN